MPRALRSCLLSCCLVLFTGASVCAAEPSETALAPLAASQRQMIERDLKARGIADPRLLLAFEKVRREVFCLPEYRALAYADTPLPIGYEQTISQPYIVAVMTQVLRLKPGEKVLEIGTGSGYQAAILAELGAQVFTIEIVGPLAARAQETLRAEGYGGRVRVRAGDGYKGWPEEAPFDAIIVTAAPPDVPRALLDQLAAGRGRMVVPVGGQGPGGQDLRLYRKSEGGEVFMESLLPVRFVPMVGDSALQVPAPGGAAPGAAPKVDEGEKKDAANP